MTLPDNLSCTLSRTTCGSWFGEEMTAKVALPVKFQEVVVHSIENCEAEVVSNRHLQEIEWTITIMPD
jgi:hypothetical protein